MISALFLSMSVIISGSLAFDTVFEHHGRFSDTLYSDAIRHLNLTFQADTMRRTLGGCAGNIAYSLKQLGGTPLIWTAVGSDATPFFEHFQTHDIATEGIVTLSDAWTAQCVITTDRLGNQLTTFHPGAMAKADTIPWPNRNDITLGILAPSCRHTLLAHARTYIEHDIPFIFDPGQITPLFTAAELIALSETAIAVTFSDYEATMIEKTTGLNPCELSKHAKLVICTHGATGSSLWENGHETFISAPTVKAIDPVGAGDAYRGGLLYGFTLGLSPFKCAQLGTLMGATKVSVDGPTYQVDRQALKAILT